jgi:hypothetical protein
MRSRLQLPEDIERDAVLESFLLAAEERILDLTGFLTTDDPYFAPVSKTEDLADVQRGVSRLLRYRPVLTASCASRSLGGTTFTDATVDLRDAFRGRVMVISADVFGAVEPMSGYYLGSSRPPWSKWQEAVLSMARFTYTVDPLGSNTNPIPASLNRAAVEWAAAIYSMSGGGAVRSYSAGQISETFADKMTMPAHVTALLSRYVRNQASIVV